MGYTSRLRTNAGHPVGTRRELNLNLTLLAFTLNSVFRSARAPLRAPGVAAGLLWLLMLTPVFAQEVLYIKKGSIVYIEYAVERVDGSLVTSNIGKEPVVYEAGGNRILPSLDLALRGRKAGDSDVVRLSAEAAFGLVDEALLVEIPLDQLPVDARTPGSVLVAENPQGGKQRVVVKEVGSDVAVLDYNHPLAGQEIIYRVRILDVR